MSGSVAMAFYVELRHPKIATPMQFLARFWLENFAISVSTILETTLRWKSAALCLEYPFMKSKIVCLSVFCAMAMSPMANAEGVAGKWMLAPTPETHDKGQIREILKLELSGTKEIKGTAKRSDNSTFGDVKGEVDKADVKLSDHLAPRDTASCLW